ncbi:MAG: 50S ribosomal protein L21 [Candidatus Levybacteria bacterium]|nr:50S ribosomal protein L21 [Candidatus Levybacteria bacterium]
MEYAVINLGSKQYRISKGDIIEVDRIAEEGNSKIDIDNVLLYVQDGQIKIGKPKLSGVKVKAKVLEQKKGKKIRVAKFQAKVRHRRISGFRSRLTRLQIEDIELIKSKSR